MRVPTRRLNVVTGRAVVEVGFVLVGKFQKVDLNPDDDHVTVTDLPGLELEQHHLGLGDPNTTIHAVQRPLSLHFLTAFSA